MKTAIAYILGFVCLVIGLSILGQARAENSPVNLRIGCYVIDRYQELCIPSTGEIFVDVAGRPSNRHGDHESNVVSAVDGAAASPLSHATATHNIILAHQKIASDAWIDRRRNKQGDLCCYQNQDCHPVPAEDVLSHRDGVKLSDRLGGFVVPGDEIQISEDERYWLCRTATKMRCFFAPYSGS